MRNLIKKLKLKRRGIATLAAMHFYGNPSAKLKIIGVTGTNGKTTTVTLLYKIATALGYKAGLISTVENLIDGEKFSSTYTVPSTTPDPIFLNKLLGEMVEKECEYVFMEVSSHAIDQRRVAGIRFAGGVFTNLTHEHLDYHKNFADYFSAKKKFFKMLPSSAFAISNADDEYGKKMIEGIKAKRALYGFGKFENPISSVEKFRGEIKKLDSNGLDMFFNGVHVKSKLLGKFNAHNLLAVWSACSLLGFDMAKVKNVIETIEPPRGRFEHFMSPNGVLVVVDYAHTPDALEKIFSAVRDIKQTNSRIISMIGCGGDRDPLKRPVMGKIGAENSSIAIFTSDNPRGEDPEKIINDMKADLSPRMLEKVKTITNRREAILKAVKLAQGGDIILCAGKGHEDYQEIQGARHHFDDMEELKKAYE